MVQPVTSALPMISSPSDLEADAWTTFLFEMERKVDNQVAAPAETRTPNLHERSIAHRRVRMEGWRQWQFGGENKWLTKTKKEN
jgi:hypothetical protein